MKGALVSAKKAAIEVIVGTRFVVKVEAEGGNEDAKTAMLCGVVTLILRSSPRAISTECKFCIAWTRAAGSDGFGSFSSFLAAAPVVKYSFPTAMAVMEVAGMNGRTRVANHSSAAATSVLMLGTWLFSTATMRSIPVLEKAWRISGLVS